MLIGGLPFLAIPRLTDTVVRVDGAARAGADARALQITTDRIPRRALEDAGAGMITSPNLSGISVVVARTATEALADTLVILRADGEQVGVAVRGCPGGADPCVVLPGDHARLRVSDLVLVGARALGMHAYRYRYAASGLCVRACICDSPGTAVS